MRNLGLLSAAMFSPIVYSIVVGATTGTPWWHVLPIGYVERGLLLVEVLTVLAICLWGVARSRRPSDEELSE